jgi:hypothetical protein
MQFILIGLVTFCSLVYGAEPNPWPKMRSIHPRPYVCKRAPTPLILDGKLDEAAWQSAPWTDDFIDIEASARPLPRFRTRAKMLWDDQYFYIGAELEEPHVWGTLTNHDAVIFQDNDFEVFIDPNGDTHEYYEFEMNALNTTWDLFLAKPYKDGGPARNEWDIPGLKTGVHVRGTLNKPDDTDEGWTLEIAFPWSAFAEYAHPALPPKEGDQWRVDFSRVEWQIDTSKGQYQKVPKTKEDNWVWSPTGIIDMHRPERWGYVQFTRKKGNVSFRPDRDFKVKTELEDVYYAQREYQQKHGRFAGSTKELGLAGSKARLKLTVSGYEATLKGWRIREDAKIWRF